MSPNPAASLESVDGRDVSCRTMVVLLAAVEGMGVPPEAIVEGTGLSADYVFDGSNWLNWRQFGRAIANVSERVSDEEKVAIGRAVFDSPLTQVFPVVGAILPTEISVYRWVAKLAMGPNSLFYRCMSMTVQPLGKSRIELEIRMVPELATRGLGLMFQGALEQVPVLVGAPPAKVEVEVHDDTLRFQVTLAPRWRLAMAWRNLRSRVFPQREASEAQVAYELVLNRNDELRRQIEALRASEAERAHLEEGLRRAQRLESVGRLAGGVAHDFNNMLTVIRSHVSFLREDLPAGSALLEDVDGIDEASRRAAELTQQLLAFSRQQVMEFTALDVGDTAVATERMLRTLLGERVVLAMDIERESVTTYGDRGQLEQVIVNLAANARDAMPEGGTVTIEVRPVMLDQAEAVGIPSASPGAWVRVRVADDGQGMDAQTLELLFEPFFTTKGGEGTGLGMATVHGIVHQFGGFIDVRSEVDVGTDVRVYLPAHDGEVEPIPAAVIRRRRSPGSLPVLLVEDQQEVRSVLGRVLRSGGYHVIEVADGTEALRAVHERSDLAAVLSDVVMPGLTGPELMAQIREARPDMPLILMSGYASGLAGPDELRGVHFLAKPLAGPTLLAKLDEVLGAK